ncbi:MAG: DUF2332 domain-containing protein [Sporichthyaceae bacterium]
MQVTGESLVAHLRRQSATCADVGSPMYASLMASAADDLAGGGPVADVLDGWELDPGPAALALRMFGTVHRLALTGQAPALARYYPSVAGEDVEDFDPAGTWAAFSDVLEERTAQVRNGLISPPQTNEIGRSTALIGQLLMLRQRFDLPVRLVEIGASAGLNLRPDRIRIEVSRHGGIGWDNVGPPSPVVLRDPWQGDLPPLDLPIEIVARHGTDVDPVDVESAAGRLRLTSYAWPDQRARLGRLRGAFELAAAEPVPVLAESAVTTVAGLKPLDGTLTVVWHSVMWQYLPQAERHALTAAFDALGAMATPSAPVARVSMEPRKRIVFPVGVEHVVRTQTWPGDGVWLYGSAHPHGDTVVWRRTPIPG